MKIYKLGYDDGNGDNGIISLHLSQEGVRRAFKAKLAQEREAGAIIDGVDEDTAICAFVAPYYIDIREYDVQDLLTTSYSGLDIDHEHRKHRSDQADHAGYPQEG